MLTTPPSLSSPRGSSLWRGWIGFLVSGLLSVSLIAISVPGFAQGADRSPVPPLSLLDYEGDVVDLKQYEGKVVMVSFWATWCPPCIEEFPTQQKLKEAFKNDNFEVLAVNIGQKKSDIDDFLSSLEHPVNFPILLDSHSQAAREWQVKGLPTTVLIDKRGNQVLRFSGSRDWNNQETRTTVSILLDEDPSL